MIVLSIYLMPNLVSFLKLTVHIYAIEVFYFVLFFVYVCIELANQLIH